MADRLQKVLAARGIASRRAAEQLIADGKVTVNGMPAIIGQTVEESDLIEVEGRPADAAARARYLALNKPVGVVSTARATHGERTVIDLIDVPERLYPVGRLDKDTSGLLLLTNDGEWANIVTHPRYVVPKEYEALVAGMPTEETLRRLRSGVELPDGTMTSPAEVRLRRWLDGGAELSVTVIEGKKRQIRLMGMAVGHPVLRLRRVRIGSIRLNDLPVGRWRPLSRDEVESIRAHMRALASSGTRGPSADHDRRAGRRRQIDSRTRPR